MKSGAVVVAIDGRLRRLTKGIQEKAEKLLRCTKQRGVVLEIYLVGTSKMNTNVLAFPAQDDFPRPDVVGRSLGEIYLNPSYIKQHNESVEYMLVHGFLHLLGYDHKAKNDRIEMEQKERELLICISP